MAAKLIKLIVNIHSFLDLFKHVNWNSELEREREKTGGRRSGRERDGLKRKGRRRIRKRGRMRKGDR